MKRKHTRQALLNTLNSIRLGDLPQALREPIAEVLATFAEGHLYDNYTEGVNKQAIAWLVVGMQRALETVTDGDRANAALVGGVREADSGEISRVARTRHQQDKRAGHFGGLVAYRAYKMLTRTTITT